MVTHLSAKRQPLPSGTKITMPVTTEPPIGNSKVRVRIGDPRFGLRFPIAALAASFSAAAALVAAAPSKDAHPKAGAQLTSHADSPS